MGFEGFGGVGVGGFGMFGEDGFGLEEFVIDGEDGFGPSGEMGTRGKGGDDGLGDSLRDGGVGVFRGVPVLFGGWTYGFVGLGMVGLDGELASIECPELHPPLALLQSTGWLMIGKHVLDDF